MPKVGYRAWSWNATSYKGHPSVSQPCPLGLRSLGQCACARGREVANRDIL